MVMNPFDRESVKAANRANGIARASAGILDLLSVRPGATTRELDQAVRGRGNYIRDATRLLWEDGKITAEPREGRGGGIRWFLAPAVTVSTVSPAPE